MPINVFLHVSVMTVDVPLVSQMPDSSILVKRIEQICNLIWKGESRLESLVLSRKKDHNGTAFRTVFHFSHSEFEIASIRIFREFEKGINGDGGQDL